MSKLAWHFCRNDMKLGYNDGRYVIPGEILSVQNPEKIECCEYGLHGSENILDALIYAPGNILCRVELSGVMDIESDKISAEHREVLWMCDCENILREFSRWCALQVTHLWDCPDIVLRYLKTGDFRLRSAARAAAWATASDNQEQKLLTLLPKGWEVEDVQA